MISPFLRALLFLALAGLFTTATAQEAVRSFTAGSYEQIVAGGNGQPLVVVVWSLDCAYCEPSFKALADAQRRAPLQVVTIATDRADDNEAVRLIRDKVSHSQLQGQIWAFGPAPAERLRVAIDRRWRGGMPRSYWYDDQGQKHAYSGIITEEKINKFLAR